jgi:hypothetical protein
MKSEKQLWGTPEGSLDGTAVSAMTTWSRQSTECALILGEWEYGLPENKKKTGKGQLPGKIVTQ